MDKKYNDSLAPFEGYCVKATYDGLPVQGYVVGGKLYTPNVVAGDSGFELRLTKVHRWPDSVHIVQPGNVERAIMEALTDGRSTVDLTLALRVGNGASE